MPISTLALLQLFLRPPGRGIYIHSTGGHHTSPLLSAIYGTPDDDASEAAWRRSLERIGKASCLLIGIPSDTGTGMMRGANFGPIGVRGAYLAERGKYPEGLLDVGDVNCVQQLLHDDMLSAEQLASTRADLYPGESEPLPVSPMSIAEQVFYLLHELNPTANIIVLGGDHGLSWPCMLYCYRRCGTDFGMLQLDAHDDLSKSRQGIKHCYSTWVYNTLDQKLIKPHHIVQVGLRNSEYTKEEWEQQLPIRQIWDSEIHGRERKVIAEIVQYFQKYGVRDLYISNDIDGTDTKYAPATGTPEPGGLKPAFVKRILKQLGRHFRVFGGDIMEVAPTLAATRDYAKETTCRLAANYLQALWESFPKR